MKKIFLFSIVTSIFLSCRKEYSCEKCIETPAIVDTIRMYAGANHNSSITLSWVLSISDTLDTDISGTIEVKANGITYQRTLTIPAGQLFTQVNTQDAPREDWDIYSVSMRIINASPNKGNGWIVKY